MAKFKWEGLTKDGKKTGGEFDAKTEKEVKPEQKQKCPVQ